VKTDKADSRHLRMLWLMVGCQCRGSCPGRSASGGCCCSSPGPGRGACRLGSADARHAVPPGRPRPGRPVVRPEGARVAGARTDIGLSATGAQAVAVALRRIDNLEAELAPVRAQIAAIVWAFLGDAQRFSFSAQAVRHAGLDVTVHSSDGKHTPGTCRTRDRRSCAGPCSGRPPDLTRQLPRPLLLRRRRGVDRRQPGRLVGRPQVRPPLPPHPAPPHETADWSRVAKPNDPATYPHCNRTLRLHGPTAMPMCGHRSDGGPTIVRSPGQDRWPSSGTHTV